MAANKKAAIIAAVVLALLMIFQALLAAGLPLGKAAWGGEHRVLPDNLRYGSLSAIVILGIAAWVVLARAGLVRPGAESTYVKIFTWVFGIYFALNTIMNIMSPSPPERYIMTPVSLLLVTCFALTIKK